MQDGRRVGDWIADRYEIFDIHTGGMGVVYVVYDHQAVSGHRVLAIKTLRDEFLRDRKSNIRFTTECGAWIKLDRHPYIVRAYSVQEIQGKPHAVLELVRGGDLRRWIGTPRLDLRQLLRFSVQFCLGMEHAILKGVHCHRDIKPENLLISEGGTLKITDFGLAKVKAESLAAAAGGFGDPIPLAEAVSGWFAFNTENSRPVTPDESTPPADCPDVPGPAFPLPGGRDPLAQDFDPGDIARNVEPLVSPGMSTAEESFDPNRTLDLSPQDLPWPDPAGSDEDLEQTVDRPARSTPTPRAMDEFLATFDWVAFTRPAEPGQENTSGGFPPGIPPATSELHAASGGPRERGVTLAGAMLGTAPYMAPEQFRDAQAVDLRADIYSFGVVMFEMITGHRPFLAETFMKLAYQHEKTPPPAITRFIPRKHSRVAKAVDRIVQRCLAKDPAKRYLSFVELRRDLSQCLWYVARERLGPPTEIELEAWELTNKGVSLGILGRFQEERVSYEESIRVKPDYAPAWFNQAAAMGASDRPGEAIDYAEVALYLNAASVPALINKALALNALGRPDDALAHLDIAVHLQPRDPEVWYGRAYVLLGLSNYEGARSALTQALRLRPTYPEVLYGIGVVLSRTSTWSHAQTFFERAGDRASLLAVAGHRDRGELPPLLTTPWVRRTEDTIAEDNV